MNTVDLLLFEHSIIRIRANEALLATPSMESFKDLHELVVNLHAKVEDEVVFPAVIEENESDQEFVKYVKRISADHRLIETLGNNIVEWYEQGNAEMLNRRVPLYFKVLTDHNMNEERDIFHRLRTNLGDRGRKFIVEFGVERYSRITGISAEIINTYLG